MIQPVNYDSAESNRARKNNAKAMHDNKAYLLRPAIRRLEGTTPLMTRLNSVQKTMSQSLTIKHHDWANSIRQISIRMAHLS